MKKQLVLMLIFIFIALSCEGQIKIDENNDFTFDKDTVYVDVPYEVTVYDTVYQDVLRDYTDEEQLNIIHAYSLVDTIQASSDIFNLDYTDSMQRPTEAPEYYLMIRGEGIQKVLMDSTQVFFGPKELTLKRIQLFGHTYYELLE